MAGKDSAWLDSDEYEVTELQYCYRAASGAAGKSRISRGKRRERRVLHALLTPAGQDRCRGGGEGFYLVGLG